MPGDFQLIDSYLCQRDNLPSNSITRNRTSSVGYDSDFLADQQVPQTFSPSYSDESFSSETELPKCSCKYTKNNEIPENLSTHKNDQVNGYNDAPTCQGQEWIELSSISSQQFDSTTWIKSEPEFEDSSDSRVKISTYDVSMSYIEDLIGQRSFADNSDVDMMTNIVNQVKCEINSICKTLHIPTDMLEWTHADVQAWLLFILQKSGMTSCEVINFADIDGVNLFHMTENDLTFFAPYGAETIFTQLEIWKNALNITDESSYMDLDEKVCAFETRDTRMCDDSFTNTDRHPMGPESVSCHNNHSSTRYHDDILTFDPSDPPNKKQTIHLWQFLKQLLISNLYPHCIRWLDRSRGIFKIENSSHVAKLWGRRKNRPAMNYDKLSRSIRQYYKKGIICKTEQSKRLVYQFCRPYLS